MGIIIDARLEQSSPCIYLRSLNTGQVLMSWNSQIVTQWLESGDISCEELSSNQYSWQDLLSATRE